VAAPQLTWYNKSQVLTSSTHARLFHDVLWAGTHLFCWESGFRTKRAMVVLLFTRVKIRRSLDYLSSFRHRVLKKMARREFFRSYFCRCHKWNPKKMTKQHIKHGHLYIRVRVFCGTCSAIQTRTTSSKQAVARKPI
jgi:hypothetical protein